MLPYTVTNEEILKLTNLLKKSVRALLGALMADTHSSA